MLFGSHFVFIVYAKTVMFTTCYTAEMDSAQNHIETTLEVLFLKNAYCILSMLFIYFGTRLIFMCKAFALVGFGN